MGIKDIFTGGFFKAAAGAYQSRQERKANEKTLEAKIIAQKQSGEQQIALSEKEWEVLHLWQQESTWKDEYVTVSVVSIFNLIVIGGLASAFGYPQVLEGITTAVVELNGVLESPDGGATTLGKIMTATIFMAIGVYAWKKL